MRRVLQIGALVLLASLAVGLVLALVHEPAGRAVQPFSIRAQLSPREAQFGDTVVATLDVSGGRDPANIRVRSNFEPYAVTSRSRSVRTDGSGTVVRVVSRLRCLELECVPRKGAKSFLFRPAVVSYQGRTIVSSWPRLRVRSRVTTADVAAPVLRVPPPLAAPVQYRVSPDVTGFGLLALAGLLAAGGAALLLWVGLQRITPPRRRVAPLEQVLRELAASCANGDSGRRRRALEELASQLEPIDEPLSFESRVLAWGPRDPRPDAISDLTSRVRTAVRT